MSRTFSLSVASPYPTKPFDPGAASLDQRTLALCGDDKVDSVTSGTWTKCSSPSAANAIIFGEPWTRMATSSISWSHAIRDRRAAKRFFRKVLKHQERPPLQLVTDKLRTYSAVHREVFPSVTHRTGQHENNRAEVSPTHAGVRTPDASLQISGTGSTISLSPRRDSQPVPTGTSSSKSDPPSTVAGASFH